MIKPLRLERFSLYFYIALNTEMVGRIFAIETIVYNTIIFRRSVFNEDIIDEFRGIFGQIITVESRAFIVYRRGVGVYEIFGCFYIRRETALHIKIPCQYHG